ncbi:MAG TPA: hypothetical protein VFM37_08015 [Pseudonocardiaceae bacterium]|nr:hypothetical protein [Pseudonocardiaceae bacterium]
MPRDIIVVGGSAGGVAALRSFVSGLPPTALDIFASDIAALTSEDVEREVSDMSGYPGFSCPDCNGNPMEELDDETTRYHCRVGHARTVLRDFLLSGRLTQAADSPNA